MSDLPPTIYLRLQQDAVRHALAVADPATPTPQKAAPDPAPRPDGYVLEPKKHPAAPQPALVHTAACTMPQRTTMPITADDARIALKDPAGISEACQFCRPDTELADG